MKRLKRSPVAWALAALLWLTALVPELPAIPVERYPVYQDCGIGYCLLYDGAGNYIAGYGSVNPVVRTGFATTGHYIPEQAFYFRTDLGCAITHVAGVWNETCRGGSINGTGTGNFLVKWSGSGAGQTVITNSGILDTLTVKSGQITLADDHFNIAYPGALGSAAPLESTIRGVDGKGTNIAGGNLNLWGGISTGNAAGGLVQIEVTPAGTSGAGLNTEIQAQRWTTQHINIGNVAVPSPDQSTWQSYNATGTNATGSTLSLGAGAGTGTGGGGLFQLFGFVPNSGAGGTAHTTSVVYIATTGTDGQIIFGGATSPNGGIPSHLTPGSVILRGQTRSGTDLAGGKVTVLGGPGNGSGATGDVEFVSVAAGASSSTRNTTTAASATMNGSAGTWAFFKNTDFQAHVQASGTAPTVSACGTGPSITGSDVAGKATIGTGGVASSCTLTFAAAYAAAPACYCNNETTFLLCRATTTITTLTLASATPFTASDVVSYSCVEGS